MPRPGIVRADTLDLQNTVSPSAQDHSHSPSYNEFDDKSLLPHQASEVRHTLRERQAEQQHMQDHWRRADAGPEHDSEYGVDSEPRVHSDESPEDAEGDIVTEDDLMGGRISSSPSIDDGTSMSFSAAPKRSPSLTVSSSPVNTLHATASCRTARSDGKENVNPCVLRSHTSAPRASALSHSLPSNVSREISSGNRHRPCGEYKSAGSPNLPAKHDVSSMPLFPSTMYAANRHSAVWNTAAPFFGDESEDLSDLHGIIRELSPTDSDCSWSSSSDFSDFAQHSKKHSDDDVKKYDDLDVDDPFLCIDSRIVQEKGLRETEDINFDFVYALHTFIATVEGQANATKGDTMVLLDDSNSYWWLVRLAKDNSIGYLPAEHIETPSERLARLNKHRNVELCAPKLGDEFDKPKNSLKKAIRRRNGKSVSFASPTYIEPSDYDYTTDEDDTSPEDVRVRPDVQRQEQTQQQAEQQREQQQNATSRTSTTAATSAGSTSSANAMDDTQGDLGQRVASPVQDDHDLDEPLSPKLLEKNEAAPLKTSRKGTPRNADSFLRDDSAETHKMSLTPGWLARDESNGTGPAKDADNGSLESIERASTPDRSKLGDKKKKEKKPGMLGGLFKRKDKKDDRIKKKDELEIEQVDSDENKRPTRPQTKDTVEIARDVVDRKSSLKKNKLGKANKTNGVAAQIKTAGSLAAELEGSQVAHEAPTGREDEIKDAVLRSKQQLAKNLQIVPPPRRGQLNDQAADAIESPTFMHGTEAVHIPATQEEMTPVEQQRAAPAIHATSDEQTWNTIVQDLHPGGTADMTPVSAITEPKVYDDEYDERPSAIEADSEKGFAAGDDDSATPIADNVTTAPMPQPIAFGGVQQRQAETPTPVGSREADSLSPQSLPQRQESRSSATTVSVTSPSPAPSKEVTWSDAGLRAWLDNNSDVRDMLLVVHDTSDVQPVGKDHPLMASLFVDETKSLQKLSSELDSMLDGLLQRQSDGGPVAVSASG